MTFVGVGIILTKGMPMPCEVGDHITTTTMATHQISFDNGITWTDFVPPMGFPMEMTDIHFFHRNADSYLQVKRGGIILRLFIAKPFSLKAIEDSDDVLVLQVGNEKVPEHVDSFSIDFGRPSSGFSISPNAGGIGIADIRDNFVVLNAVVFNLNVVQLYWSNAELNSGTVELLFSPMEAITIIQEPEEVL